MFVINLHKALASLATATLESVIQERFGSRCARIFRLVLQKKHVQFFTQAIGVDPLANALGGVTSDAATMLIGN